MEYSFNCNVASNSQLHLCCSEKQLQIKSCVYLTDRNYIQVNFDVTYLRMILFNFLSPNPNKLLWLREKGH